MVGENLHGEIALLLFPLVLGGEELCSAPLVYTTQLNQRVLQMLGDNTGTSSQPMAMFTCAQCWKAYTT